MAVDNRNTASNIVTKDVNGTQVIERKHIRWMMVLYDLILYLLCWLFVFAVQLPVVQGVGAPVVCIYLGAGFVLFFGVRFLLRCYNQIFRYGSMHAFAREMTADLLAGILYLGLGLLLRGDQVTRVPFVFLLSFVALYVLISLIVRIAYCQLYRFAERSGGISQFLQRFLELFAHVDFKSQKPGAVLRLVLEPEKTVAAPINELQNIAEKFAIRGDITAITQINKGYINRTYRVETLSDTGNVHKYTLQRINTNVFPDVDALMSNFKLTTSHLFGRFFLPGRGKRGGCVQQLRSTKDGRAYYRDDSGSWRMLTHIDNVYSLDIPERPETFYHAGRAFGMFLKEMRDIDPSDIKEVIPNFHNTGSRYRDLETAISQDPKGRVKQVEPEIAFVRARADRFSMISDALESGKIPTRICHNDCNLNNILFDNTTHLPVAIIDLDTVMPSSPLYDYGDSMRIGTNTAKDDEKDLSKVSCDLNLYERYARGYLEACGDILTPEELELLPYASLIITAEDGIRFLADHINGDTYYNIYYPGQNLDRARTQLKLLEDMEKKLPQIKKILRNIYMDLNLNGQIE